MAAKIEITLGNDTNEHTKVCLYKAADKVDISPVEGGVVFIDPHDHKTWTPAPGEKATSFHVKYFRPALIDEFLAGANPVVSESTVTLHKDGEDYYVTVKRP